MRGFLIFWAYMLGGAEEPNRSHIMWLANRDERFLSGIANLTHMQARVLLEDFATDFAVIDGFPKTRKQLAQLAEELVSAQGINEPGDRSFVVGILDQLKNKGFSYQARGLDDLLKAYEQSN